ncbi:glycosyltransferase family 2 protein [Psychromarinibacter sp. C21-152]|uniref:Glycosyltransferase family 2 protein n=1 Tax=Psychromarinibacter sediminicola TaxID=3033385 RepID=A0AAE3NYT1_9RHOB|nr:glycosyltransferase family 2 protein [Psychromarinibacter sediminicola]MDF0603390.1 glycosyltransferase family 2 protein [Psychromarinibacter sediminicola]
MIISLTSIPPRFHLIGPTLHSLVRQHAPADRVLLHIPHRYRRFPDWDGTLPEVPDGVEIVRCAEDYGPATKVLAAAKAHAGQDVEILFCDDDRIYAPTLTRDFMAARADQPDACIAAMGNEADFFFDSRQIRDLQPRAVKRRWQRDTWFLARWLWWRARRKLTGHNLGRPARRIFARGGYVDMFMGFGGAMVRPDFFDDVAFDIPDICWTVDDIWLSGMLARRNIPIWVPANLREPANTDAFRVDALYAFAVEGAGRPKAGRHCYDLLRERYGIWP